MRKTTRTSCWKQVETPNDALKEGGVVEEQGKPSRIKNQEKVARKSNRLQNTKMEGQS